MKLLHEEIFGMIFKFIKEINILPIRILVKAVFYLVIFGILGLIIWMIVTGRYVWAGVVVGLIVLGEIAHFIRKSREKVMNKRIEMKNDIEDEVKNPLNKEGLVLKSKNKVVKTNSMKKKVILRKEKVINKEGLLPKKL